MGEDLLKTNISRKTYFPVYLMITTLIALLAYVTYKGLAINSIALKAVVIFSLLGIASTEFHRWGESYEITPTFFVHNRGRVKKNIRKIAINCISDLGIDQTVWQRILNFGTVNVYAFSEGSKPIQVRNISNPRKFTEFLEQKMNEIRGMKKDHGEPQTPLS